VFEKMGNEFSRPYFHSLIHNLWILLQSFQKVQKGPQKNTFEKIKMGTQFYSKYGTV